MPTKLKQLLIDRVDLVGKGDNPEAHIALFKNADNPDGGDALEKVIKRFEELLDKASSKTKGVEEMFDMKKFMEELPEDQRDGLKKHLDTLESAKIKTLTKQLEDKEASVTELTETVADLKKAADAKDDSNGTPEDVIKELPEDVRKMVEDSLKKAEASEAEVKKLRDESLTKEYIEKASVFEALPVVAQDIGPVFKRVAEVNKEDFEKLEALLKAADEQLKENNVLLTELGSGDAGSAQPAWDQLDAAANELMKTIPELTKEQAITKALRNDPALYEAYQKETREVQ